MRYFLLPLLIATLVILSGCARARITTEIKSGGAWTRTDSFTGQEKKEGQQSNLMKDSRQDLPFVRAAKSGGWRKDLPETQVARIESAWGDIMVGLGYELVTRAGGETLSTPGSFFPIMATVAMKTTAKA